MKLLILTCLVAVALARPKLPLRHQKLFQNEPDSREPLSSQFAEEIINEQSRQRELLRKKQSDKLKDTRTESTENHAMEGREQRGSTSSSSEEQLPGLNKYNLLQLESIHDQELHKTIEDSHAQLPLHQSYQLDAYPYAAWYYPPQYIAHLLFTNIPQPVAPEKGGETEVMPQW
uniref:Alpha-S1-casein n=1 Tax=Catagonus wagneri TaxID=51154 RepID=A0A8C3YCA3_9CETA